MTSAKIAVVGATGFIGSHLVAYARGCGIDAAPATMVRIDTSFDHKDTAEDATNKWLRANQRPFTELCRHLVPFDVVINAAGDPRSGSRSAGELSAANLVLPAVLARAALAAGVRRFVHISSAAVQGRLDPLNELAVYETLTPYALSKIRCEQYLLDAKADRGEVTPELVVYRPASVQAFDQPATRAFARALRRIPYMPVVGPEDRPIPVALLENVTAGIFFAAMMDHLPRIVLQPDEGMTPRRLFELFGNHRTVTVPAKPADVTLDLLGKLTGRSPYMTSRLRWVELILRGQATDARALSIAGYTAPVDLTGWEKLAAHTLRHS